MISTMVRSGGLCRFCFGYNTWYVSVRRTSTRQISSVTDTDPKFQDLLRFWRKERRTYIRLTMKFVFESLGMIFVDLQVFFRRGHTRMPIPGRSWRASGSLAQRGRRHGFLRTNLWWKASQGELRAELALEIELKRRSCWGERLWMNMNIGIQCIQHDGFWRLKGCRTRSEVPSEHHGQDLLGFRTKETSPAPEKIYLSQILKLHSSCMVEISPSNWLLVY